MTYQSTDKSLQIKAVIAPSYAKGFLYVEAYKHPFVKQAIEGISSLKSGMRSQQVS